MFSARYSLYVNSHIGILLLNICDFKVLHAYKIDFSPFLLLSPRSVKRTPPSTGISISPPKEAGEKVKSISSMSRRTAVTDKQDFFLPGRVQVYALTLRHTQLLFTACVQSHSRREDKSCPKFNSTLKGTTPSQISGPKPGGRHPGELLISQRKHLPQRLLLAEVIKKISGNACSFESPGKQLLDGCNRLTNRTLALDFFEA